MIIDADTHIIPSDAFDYVDDRFARRKPRLKFDEAGQYQGVDFPGIPPQVPGATPLAGPGSGGAKYRGIADIEARLADCARMGIDQQILLPQFSGWWSYLIERQLATAMAHSYNLSILRLMRAYPESFIGAAVVPLQDPTAAIDELEWAKGNGFATVVIDWVYPVWSHPYGTTLGEHTELWPFFRRAEELEFPLYLHAVQHGHKLSNFGAFQRLGLEIFATVWIQAQMNLVSLITSGLLDDFPRLKLIHSETGTAFIKPLAQTMDAAFKGLAVDFDDDENEEAVRERKARTPAAGQPRNQLAPSTYLRRNFWFTIETEQPELADTVAFLGADRFLFATDYPHDDKGGRMKFRDVELLAVNAHISEADKELIRWKNAVELFRLPAAVPA